VTAHWLRQQFADSFKADQADHCFEYKFIILKLQQSSIKTLTTEQPFTDLHCDCRAETWLVGQQRQRNCSVQSAGLTVAWFQVLSAVLLMCADGSVLVGFGSVPVASKGHIASNFRIKHSWLAVRNVWNTSCFLAGNVTVINKGTNIPSNCHIHAVAFLLCNNLYSVNSLRTKLIVMALTCSYNQVEDSIEIKHVSIGMILIFCQLDI
jgi:hypothetical protein